MNRLSGIKRIALIDTAASDAVVINKILASSTYTSENIATDTTDGSVYGGRSHSLDVQFSDADTDLIDQLLAWQESGTQLIIAALGLQSNLLWYTPAVIDAKSILNANARDGVSVNQILLDVVAGDPDIKVGVNLLLANVFRAVSGNYTPPRVTSAQTITASNYGATLTASATGTLNVEILFPFDGQRVDFGVDNGTGQGMTVQPLDVNKNTIGAAFTSSVVSSRRVGSGTTPAGTCYLRVILTTSTALAYSNITLRVDGRNVFTNS